MKDTFTREQYLAGLVSHERYYGQFIDSLLRAAVASAFGTDRLIAAYKEDANFNSIPLYKWDSWYSIMNNSIFWAELRAVGEQFSLSTVVCVIKEAARQVVANATY